MTCEEDERQSANSTDGYLVRVYWAADAHDVHVVRGLLEEAGIRARVIGESLATMYGVVLTGSSVSPRVCVFASHESRARQVIAEWEEKRQAARTPRPIPTWKCGHCGEDVDGNFDVCWSCQSPKADLPRS